jgi:hypothetical protein
MFNYFISLVKHLPSIRGLEYHITEQAYSRESPEHLKKAFLEKDSPSREGHEIPRIVDIIVDTFKKMPLSLQMDHIFKINCYQDDCTFFEPYMIGARAAQAVVLNRLMVSYAEIIIPQLHKEQKGEFLDALHKSIRKGGFMGAKYYEEDELILISKWQLEHELAENHFHKPKKVMKL